MRALVCGGRDFHDELRVILGLNQIHADSPITVLINGGARGVDRLAWKWALDREIPVRVVLADWALHGRRAGPIRNQKMLDEEKPEIVVAFPGGTGTADMVRRAKKAGLWVIHAS